MKKTILFITLILAGFYLQAQTPKSITLNAYGSYNFNERVPLDAYTAEVKGGFQWGAGLEYFVQRNQSIELKYMRMDTKTPVKGPAGTILNEGNDDAAFNYILLGGNRYFPKSSSAKVIPFAGMDLGIGWAEGPQDNSGTKFAWDAKLGVKILTNSSVSFKLNAYVQSMISTFGYDYWYYPGWGTAAVPDYANVFQFGLGGAICFDFKK